MKRKLGFVLITLVFLQVSTFAGVTLRYSNRDSQAYEFSVKISGSSKTVYFQKSSTTSVTIQGGSDEAVIKTSNGDVKVEDGDTIEIKNGKITVK